MAEVKTVTVTFTAAPSTPGGSPKPGTWSYQPSPPTVEIESGVTAVVEFQLSPNSTAGWGFQALSIGEHAPGSSTGGVVVTTTTPMPTSVNSYNGFSVQFTQFAWDGIYILIVNNRTKAQGSITLGTQLVVGNDSGDKQESRDPQIVLLPTGG